MKLLVCTLAVVVGAAAAQAQQPPYLFVAPPLKDEKPESKAPGWDGPVTRLTPQQLSEMLEKRSARPAPKPSPKTPPPGKLCLLQFLEHCAQEPEIFARPYTPGDADLYFLKPEAPRRPAPPAVETIPHN